MECGPNKSDNLLIIILLILVFENSEKMILVMEYCSGGELYDYLSQKKVLQEDEARR